MHKDLDPASKREKREGSMSLEHFFSENIKNDFSLKDDHFFVDNGGNK
jgi:hypothetical protein